MSVASATEPRERRSPFAPPQIEVERRADGAIVMRSRVPIHPVRASGMWLERWAAEAPDRVFLAQRDAAGGWRKLTYADALAQARAVGQALLDRKLSPERPIMILADNGIEHAVLVLGALHVGIPVAPVSPAYARMSRDFAKLKHVADLLDPQLVFLDVAERYTDALAAIGLHDAEIVAAEASGAARITPFADLLATRATPAVDDAFARVGPDTVAKVLFTSGSTDMPKGVINTQRMICANQESIAAIWPFLTEEPPVIVDWLPWNHTFGGNHNFNMMLRNGGTLTIDEGKPTPALIAPTIANLREVAPSAYFNVPLGYAFLLDHLEADEALNRNFFSRLRLIFYAGASLPQSSWDRLEACSRRALGYAVPMISSWGTTETAPMVTCVHWEVDRAGLLGVPAPGNALKLQPVDERLEMMARGPNITPGYWKRPDLTEKAFDSEGFYRTGDAAKLVDPDDPAQGVLFDGRVAENFKLGSGTWVNVGALRVAVIAACAPLVADAVLTGHDRDEIGVLVFPNVAACRALCPDLAEDCAPEAVLAHAAVREAIAQNLRWHNAAGEGSSTRVRRVLLLAEPPSVDANEITDKGYINQRAVLQRRAALVERLYAEPAAADVIVV